MENEAAQVKQARGDKYVSLCTGKSVLVRIMGSCSYRRECLERFSDKERGDILKSFCSLEKDVQDSHHFGLVHSNSVKRCHPRAGGGPPRQATYSYIEVLALRVHQRDTVPFIK